MENFLGRLRQSIADGERKKREREDLPNDILGQPNSVVRVNHVFEIEGVGKVVPRASFVSDGNDVEGLRSRVYARVRENTGADRAVVVVELENVVEYELTLDKCADGKVFTRRTNYPKDSMRSEGFRRI
jgi:hypothetical protein